MTPTQELVLDCYRSPHLLHSLADAAIPLPEGMDKVLREAVAPASPDARVDAGPLREATLLYVKRVMLLDEADHYRVLGLRFDATSEKIDAHYRLLLALLQMDTSTPTRELSRRIGRVSRAHAVLSDARRRKAYDKARFGALVGDDFQLPVEMLVKTIVEDQARKARATTMRASMTGELQPWAPPEVQGSRERISSPDHQAGFDVAETRVFRGPSNGALLAMSGAALLVILAVSPVIVSHYSAYFMPPDTTATAPTSDVVQPPGQATSATTLADVHGFTPAPLSFLTTSQDAPGAPLALFAGGDDAVFRSAVDADSDALENSMLEEPEIVDVAAGLTTEADLARGFDNLDLAAADHFGAAELVNSTEAAEALDPFPVSDQADGSIESKTSVEDAATPAHAAMETPQPPPITAAVTPAIDHPGVAAPAVSATPSDAATMLNNSNAAPVSAAANKMTSSPSEAAVPVKLIDSYDLAKLVEQLATTYREGDADAFVGLFAENARTNDQPDRLGIAADYQELFRATERRSLQVDDVQWKRMEDGAVGEGRFVVRIKPKWKKREEVVSGKLTLEVKQQDRQLAITGLFHDYGAPPRP